MTQADHGTVEGRVCPWRLVSLGLCRLPLLCPGEGSLLEFRRLSSRDMLHRCRKAAFPTSAFHLSTEL